MEKNAEKSEDCKNARVANIITWVVYGDLKNVKRSREKKNGESTQNHSEVLSFRRKINIFLSKNHVE